MDETETF